MKLFIVTEFYDVQRTFHVEAKTEQEAKDLVYSGDLEPDDEDWESSHTQPTEVKIAINKLTGDINE